MPNQPPLKQITEAEADPETAALYADIRQTLNAASVNLVWRHIASIEHALGWLWPRLKPLYQQYDLTALLPLPQAVAAPRWPMSQLASLGLRNDDVTSICAIVEHYHRTNPQNLLALSAARAALRGTALPRRSRPGPSVVRAAKPVALPKLISEAEMSPDLLKAVREFDALGLARGPQAVVAGVPRHLAHWPGFLQACRQLLCEHEAVLADSIMRIQRDAMSLGAELAGEISMHTAAPQQALIIAAIERFSAPELISNYIVKVGFIRSAMPRR